jgi:hypothetical protein
MKKITLLLVAVLALAGVQAKVYKHSALIGYIQSKIENALFPTEKLPQRITTQKRLQKQKAISAALPFDPVTSFFEDFDGTGLIVPNLPEGWSTIIRGANIDEYASIRTFTWSAPFAPSAPNVVELYNGNSSDPTDEIILVCPQVSNLAAGTHRLRFMSSGNGNVDLNTIEIVTLNGNGQDAVATPYETIATENGILPHEYSVDFGSYIGTDTYIGIKFNAGMYGQLMYVDNISWEAVPLCPDVDLSSIIVPVVNPTNASASWLGTGASQWEIMLAEGAENNPTGTLLLPFSSAQATFQNLTPSSEYTFWVRTVCGANHGVWAGPVRFTTDCNGISSFAENFDDLEAPALPQCWSKIIDPMSYGMYAPSLGTIANIPYSAPNAVSFNRGTMQDTEGSDRLILVSPRLTNIGAGTHRLKFFARSTTPDVLQIVGLNGNTKYAAETLLGQFTITSGDMMPYILNSTAFEGTSYSHIGIRFVSFGGNSMYVDNINWEPIPACPEVSAINVQAVSTTTAQIGWTPGGSETQWQIAYGNASETNPEGLPTVLANGNPTGTIPGLDPATSYKAWVRPVCFVESGIWQGPVEFTTSCVATNTIEEGFEGLPYDDLPVCWSVIKRGADLAEIGANAGAQNGILWMTRGEVEGPNYDVIAVTPQLTNLSAGTHHLTFDAFMPAFPGQLQIGTLSNNGATAVFTPVQTLSFTPGTTTPQPFDIDFTSYTGTDAYIGIRVSGDGFLAMAVIDNVVWAEPVIEVPPCAPVTDITSDTVTTSGANITWTAGGSETQWEVAYSDDPDATIAEATVIPVDGTIGAGLSELETLTQYYVWVRALCDDNNSEWTGPYTFTTNGVAEVCLPQLLINESFDTTAQHELPTCWTKIQRGSDDAQNAIIETTEVTGYDSNIAVIYGSTADIETDDLILVLPQLINLSAGTHQLKFNAFIQDTTTGIQVGTLTSNTIGGVFTPLQDIDVTLEETPELFTVDFTGYTGPDTYIGIRLNSDHQHAAVMFDNVVWEPADIVGTESFESSGFSYYPNPVNDMLTVSYKDTIESIAVYNLLGQQVLQKEVNATQVQTNLSALAQGTYLVKVTAGGKEKSVRIIKQ